MPDLPDLPTASCYTGYEGPSPAETWSFSSFLHIEDYNPTAVTNFSISLASHCTFIMSTIKKVILSFKIQFNEFLLTEFDDITVYDM